MYKNGSMKIELSSPNLYIGNTCKNAQSIIQVLNQSKSSFVLFSELCLSGYTAGDLFFETTFLEENLKSLKFIINNNHFEGIYFIGMPFLWEEVLYNVAIVIQKGKILGIVPKHTIPNYKEFKEKRWFQSGKIIQTQIIDFLGQKVPIGNILFVNKMFDIVFGVEICQDLWNIESPSDLLVLNGAHLIFNLSASTEYFGKVQLRRLAVANHSRKQIGGYFYTSSGITESPTDTLFSNHKIAAVLGNIIGEKDLFNSDISLVVDVFIDAIKYQRRIDTTYADQKIGKEFPFFKSYFELKESQSYELEKKLSEQPFLSDSQLVQQLKLSNIIQVSALQTKLSHIPNVQVIFQMKASLNELLTLLVLIQSFSLTQKPWKQLKIIMLRKDFPEEKIFILIKQFLIDCGINNIIHEKIMTATEVKEKCISNLNQKINSNNIPNINDQAQFFNQPQQLILKSYNLSEIALGLISPNFSYDDSYNVNVGIPNTLMVKLIFFHLKEEKVLMDKSLKEFFFHQIEQFLTKKIIIEDFILYHHLNNNFFKEKIAFFLQKTFLLTFPESLELVTKYIQKFYQSQYQRQKMSPGPKILENSLSYRTELQLPINFQREK